MYNNKLDIYVEIYIQSELHKIKKKRMKKLKAENLKNIWGVDIKPEFPRNPTIILKNDFKKNTLQMANLLIQKIKKVQ